MHKRLLARLPRRTVRAIITFAWSTSPFAMILGGIGTGTYEQIGSEAKFKISMNLDVSDGSKLRSEGVVDHPSRSYTGQLYEG